MRTTPVELDAYLRSVRILQRVIRAYPPASPVSRAAWREWRQAAGAWRDWWEAHHGPLETPRRRLGPPVSR